MEYLYGTQPVLAALGSAGRRISQVLIYENAKTLSPLVQEILDRALERQVKIQFTTKSQLDDLCDRRPHQNVALQVHPLRIPTAESPLAHVASPTTAILLADLTDPQNVGTILRTAFFLGIERVYLTKGCSHLTPTVSKASAGSLETFHDRIAYCSKGSSFITAAHGDGWETIASGIPSLPQYVGAGAAEGSVRQLLVLGNEGSGIPRGMADVCQFSMRVEGSASATRSALDSLNVGAAAAILMSRLMDNRRVHKVNLRPES